MYYIVRGVIECFIEVGLWWFKVYPLVWDWIDSKLAENGCSESPYVNELLQAYCFLTILFCYQWINDICFQTYSVFVIEEKFNFNRQKFSKFLLVEIFKLILNALAMAAVVPVVLWIMVVFDDYLTITLFIAVSLYILIFFIVYPICVKPISTKFTELKR